MEVLRVEELTVSRGERKILDGVTFKLNKGEKVIIAGDNGAGKTTLIETIMGFIPAERGKIYLKGREIKTEEDFYLLRTTVGYVFQNPDDQLFSLTVEEEPCLYLKLSPYTYCVPSGPTGGRQFENLQLP
jgi:cobalt/nickel transport system ATP-binding protein